MTRPRLLDLFCGAGGAGDGYRRAGFDVTGVDIEPHDYPCGDFIVADALDVLDDSTFLASFDVIHASPPCQAYSVTRHSHSNEHPELVEPTREALQAWGGPYVIENVPGAPLRDAVRLCGSMFGLTALDIDGVPLALRRHRLFESNTWLMGAGGCVHTSARVGGVYGGGVYDRVDERDRARRGGCVPRVEVARQLMGIPWMTRDDLTQAIPPAYTEYIGAQLLHHVRTAA